MGSSSQSIIIAAPREKVYSVITDFVRYPEFLPEIKKVDIGTSSEDGTVISFSAHVIAPLEYTLRIRFNPPEGLTWTFVRGTLVRKNEGGWNLKELGKGKTEATYYIELGFGPLVPGIISSTLAGSTLPSTLKRFKERIEGMGRRRK